MIMDKQNQSQHLLEVRDLKTSFFTAGGEVKAVNGVSYYVGRQEVVAIVGESGCGKSVTQMSTLQLVQDPPGRIIGGQVIFKGNDLLRYGPSSREMRAIRGAEIAMIFQEPMTSLNPVFTVGQQLSQVIRVHTGMKRRAAWQEAIRALQRVGIPDAEARMNNYPYQMSGGMRQRVMIATAIACQADLIIADEPTTALDVTTQAQVMELLISVVQELRTALIIVTHNLGLVTRYADRIYVMYAGRIVESGPTEQIMKYPRHPYTIGLLESVPNLNDDRDKELKPIQGAPPIVIDLPDQCAFLPRCPYASEQCRQGGVPPLRVVQAPDHCAACCFDWEGNDK